MIHLNLPADAQVSGFTLSKACPTGIRWSAPQYGEPSKKPLITLVEVSDVIEYAPGR